MHGSSDWAVTGFGLALILVLMLEAVWLSHALSRRLGDVFAAPGILKCALGLTVFVATEGLSFAHLLEPVWIRGLWSIVAVVGGLIAVRERKALDWSAVTKSTGATGLALKATGVILALTLLTALVSPPNTWDALSYHNARVLQWLDHQSIAAYATPIDRQIRMPPLASYMRLHLFALTGNDWLFNIPQWLFLALTSMEIGQFVGFRTAGLGAGLGVLITASQPMAILQASSSQNDLIVGGYFVSAALLLVRARMESVGWAALFGLCTGLCALTKGTGYVLGGLCAAVAVFGWFRRERKGGHVLAALILALLLNVPHLWRVSAWSGTLLPHREMVPTEVLLSPLALLSQLQRNVLLELDVVGAALDAGAGAFGPSTVGTDENQSGNTLFFLLALVVTASDLRSSSPESQSRRPLLALGWLSFIALALSIRSMLWNTRLHTPALLVLGAPVAFWLHQRCNGSDRRRTAIVGVLFFSSLPYLLWNSNRPLLPLVGRPSLFQLSRSENLFRAQPQLQEPVERVISQMPATCSHSRPVRLELSDDDGEYLIWAASLRAGRDVSFRHPDAAQPVVDCGVIKFRCDASTPVCWLPVDGPAVSIQAGSPTTASPD